MAYKRIQGGDQTCKANQALHGQAVDLIVKIRANNHYKPKVADPVSPVTFVDKIKVPIFMACQLTDEQTGGHCPTLAEHLTGTERKWFTFTNGTHVDSLDPETFNRWYDFLISTSPEQAPITTPRRSRPPAPVIYQEAMGISGRDVAARPDPAAADLRSRARRRSSSCSRSAILFDNGAGSSQAGPAATRASSSRSQLPHPGHDGPLVVPRAGRRPRRHARPAAPAPTRSPGTPTRGRRPTSRATRPRAPTACGPRRPRTSGRRTRPGSAASYVTGPLSANTTVIGAGAVHAWVRSSTPNVDLQATISEVRPDGKETFVQGGWLRANERKLDAARARRSSPS